MSAEAHGGQGRRAVRAGVRRLRKLRPHSHLGGRRASAARVGGRGQGGYRHRVGAWPGGAGAPRHGRGKGRAGSPGGGRVALQADACKGRGPRWSPGCGPGFSHERVSAKTHLSERVNLLKFKGFIALQLSRLAQFSISWWVCGYSIPLECFVNTFPCLFNFHSPRELLALLAAPRESHTLSEF